MGCRPRHRGKVWLMVSLYNFVRPHKSLRQGRTRRTPAMAIGLTDHVWSYREYSWLPVRAAPALTRQLDDRIRHLLTPALQDRPRGRKQAAGLPVEVREMREDEAGTTLQRQTAAGPGAPSWPVTGPGDRRTRHQSSIPGGRLRLQCSPTPESARPATA